METINISTFKATCLALLDKVKKTGIPILILKHGEPVAQIFPPPRPDRPQSWLGCCRDQGVISGDIVSPAGEETDWEVLK